MIRPTSPRKIEELLRAAPVGSALAVGINLDGARVIMQVMLVLPGARIQLRPMPNFIPDLTAEFIELESLDMWGYWYAPKGKWKPKPLFTDVKDAPPEDFSLG